MSPQALDVSVVVPTYDRPQAVRRALQAMTELDYPRSRFEVIVVDDGSPVALEEVIAPFRRHLDLTLVRQSNAGPAAARNTGANQAKGKFVAFTDDDCTPARGWLRTLEARLAAAPDHIIGGRTVNALVTNRYSVASQQLIDYLYVYYGAPRAQPRFFASNNMALQTDCLLEVGGFDTTFRRPGGEDREFCDRWQHAGYQLTFAPEAIVYHAHPMTAHSFWQQQFNYGCGAYHFHRARARRSAMGVKLEPLSFYWNLLRHPFTQTPPRQALAVAALLVVSQGATAAGFFREMLRQRRQGSRWPRPTATH